VGGGEHWWHRPLELWTSTERDDGGGGWMCWWQPAALDWIEWLLHLSFFFLPALCGCGAGGGVGNRAHLLARCRSESGQPPPPQNFIVVIICDDEA
jgi:hypothetical protein